MDEQLAGLKPASFRLYRHTRSRVCVFVK